MLVRIVKMTFRRECIQAFTGLFESRKHLIRNFHGCNHLELWQDKQEVCVFFTYSLWSSEQCLANYRASHFFDDTWQQTKKLFAARPEAWSINQLVILE